MEARGSSEVERDGLVDWREPQDTTLFHALFSSEPDNVP